MPNPPWNVMLSTCPSRTSLARIANKWTAMIVIALGDGPLRFGVLREAVGGISGKVLADTLRDLERDGIVTRHAYDQMPPRVEYELTALGRTLFEPLAALGRWAERHFDEVQDARQSYDAPADTAPALYRLVHDAREPADRNTTQEEPNGRPPRRR